MEIDKFLKVLVPKDHLFFPLFEMVSMNLIKAATQLKFLIESNETGERNQIVKAISELEVRGNKITEKINEQLYKSFLTPFDREDIHEIGSNADDVLDTINAISRSVNLYKPVDLVPVYKEMADIILKASKELEICLTSLKDAMSNKLVIEYACNNLSELEHKAGEIFYSGLSELFEKENNVLELFKNKEILERMERCIDETKVTAETIRAVLLKFT